MKRIFEERANHGKLFGMRYFKETRRENIKILAYFVQATNPSQYIITIQGHSTESFSEGPSHLKNLRN